MAQDFTYPIPPLDNSYTEPPKKKNTVMIIAIVVVVLLCCCCAVGALLAYGLWTYGDELIDNLGVFIPLLSLTV